MIYKGSIQYQLSGNSEIPYGRNGVLQLKKQHGHDNNSFKQGPGYNNDEIT